MINVCYIILFQEISGWQPALLDFQGLSSPVFSWEYNTIHIWFQSRAKEYVFQTKKISSVAKGTTFQNILRLFLLLLRLFVNNLIRVLNEYLNMECQKVNHVHITILLCTIKGQIMFSPKSLNTFTYAKFQLYYFGEHIIFLHKTSSGVEMRLHAKNHQPMYPGCGSLCWCWI